jgi:lysine/ornithine N-monooxygenase
MQTASSRDRSGDHPTIAIIGCGFAGLCVRFGAEIATARFDAEASLWRLQTTDGARFSARILISAVGQLGRPAVPQIEGFEGFAGRAFHSGALARRRGSGGAAGVGGGQRGQHGPAGARDRPAGEAPDGLPAQSQLDHAEERSRVFRDRAPPASKRRADETPGDEVIPVDAIVFATGFRTSEMLAPMRIEGAGGRTLVTSFAPGGPTWASTN